MHAAADPRRLVVNADDLGWTSGVNAGIAEARRAGILTSASLMAVRPRAAEGAGAAAELGLDLGLHVDLARWARRVEGRPVYELPDGREVRAEVERQLRAFSRLVGADPTHLDSHHHVHRDEPAAGAVLRELGSRLGIPVRWQGRVRAVELLDPSVEGLLQIVRSLGAGVTELVCHPGYVDAELESSYREERAAEVEALCDARVGAAVAAAGVELVSFRDLARADA
jgi:chitin disaccharide deacetylase